MKLDRNFTQEKEESSNMKKKWKSFLSELGYGQIMKANSNAIKTEIGEQNKFSNQILVLLKTLDNDELQ